MIYEELISRLREAPIDWPGAELYYEAADAIEELTAYVKQLEELREDGWYLQKTKMMTYGQATMTGPLPEPPKKET